jgi:hypothetical protein
MRKYNHACKKSRKAHSTVLLRRLRKFPLDGASKGQIDQISRVESVVNAGKQARPNLGRYQLSQMRRPLRLRKAQA